MYIFMHKNIQNIDVILKKKGKKADFYKHVFDNFNDWHLFVKIFTHSN